MISAGDTTSSSYLKNFPFPTLRKNQEYVLNEIEKGFEEGKDFIICEAPAGSGKSGIAIAAGLTLGSSYILTSTKNLQSQYKQDFAWVQMCKGRNNFQCPMIPIDATYTTADHAPCKGNQDYKCDLKTKLLKDYSLSNAGTRDELVNFNSTDYEETCDYYHQRNRALTASHSVLNYSMFLSMLQADLLPIRDLLVLDEAHELPSEVLKFQSFSITKKKWSNFLKEGQQIPNLGYENVKGWIEFLIGLKEQILERMKVITAPDIADIERKILKLSFEHCKSDISEILQKKKLYEKLRSFDHHAKVGLRNANVKAEEREDTNRLDYTISTIISEPLNWIVSDIKFDAKTHEVVKVELKPLDMSRKCRQIFDKCQKVLLMSATILDVDTFCKEVGLEPSKVKVIRVESTFPVENRLIYPLKVAKLNQSTWIHEDVKQSIVRAVDRIMTKHANHKGIIHCTSYDQLNYIMVNISNKNKRRLLKTDPNEDRDEIIENHFNSTEPTVLISPSLHLGLDLKDARSRFQVVVKTPWANLGDKWIAARQKREDGEKWYNWISVLRFVQSVGRSVRSEEDWALTYALDGTFGYFIMRNKDILPSWFLQSIQWQGIAY